MDADERDICIYLKPWRGQLVSGIEISKRAGGKRRFIQNPNWAVPALARLVERGVLETDDSNHFRLPLPQQKGKTKRWVAPHIQKILEQSGKSFEGPPPADEEDDFLDD